MLFPTMHRCVPFFWAEEGPIWSTDKLNLGSSTWHHWCGANVHWLGNISRLSWLYHSLEKWQIAHSALWPEGCFLGASTVSHVRPWIYCGILGMSLSVMPQFMILRLRIWNLTAHNVHLQLCFWAIEEFLSSPSFLPASLPIPPSLNPLTVTSSTLKLYFPECNWYLHCYQNSISCVLRTRRWKG